MADDVKGLLTGWVRGDFLPSRSVPTVYLTQLRDRSDEHFEIVVMLNSQTTLMQAVFLDSAINIHEKKESVEFDRSWSLFGSYLVVIDRG